MKTKTLRVCVRSPLIPARAALSSASGSETPGTEIWTNPQDSPDERDPNDLQGRISENNEKRTDEEQRKIDQDRIARNIIEMANKFPSRNSKDEGTNTTLPANANDVNTDVNGFLPDMLT